jgi:hypothetical protein
VRPHATRIQILDKANSIVDLWRLYFHQLFIDFCFSKIKTITANRAKIYSTLSI